MKRLESIEPNKALEILNKVSFFDTFNREEKEILMGFHSHFFIAADNEEVIAQGGRDRSLYILLTGKVDICHSSSTQPLASLLPGSFFGEISFLTDRPRTNSVVARGQSILFEIDKPTLKHLPIEIREKLKDNIIMVLVERLDQMNQRVIDITHARPSD